jgi:hydroxymethylpyrimidine/phosphomethylpyrimidine kinase
MLSAAIAAHLALGHRLAVAVERSLAFVHSAFVRSIDLGGDARLAGIERAECDTSVLTRSEG